MPIIEYMKNSDMYTSSRAIIAFLVLAIVFSVFMLFAMNQDQIMGSNFTQFMILIIAGSGLLISLMYFASQTKPKAHHHATKPGRKKKR